MEKGLDISAGQRDGATVALLAGRLDANQVPLLEQWFNQQLDGGLAPVVLDLSALSSISSAGLRVLLSVARQMKQRQRRFVICGLFGVVREVFMVSGFMDTLKTCHTVDEALACD